MITPGTASLAISAAKGLIKLGGRVDQLMAEQAAVEPPLVIPMPTLNGGPNSRQKKDALKKFLRDTKGQTPDPTGGATQRAAIQKAIKDFETNNSTSASARLANKIKDLFKQHLPDQATEHVIDPNQQYLQKLQEFYPAMDFADPETRLAAFYVRAGGEEGSIGYAGRIGLLIVDVVAEFGAENTALFTRDEKMQTVVAAVLKRFSEPKLEDFNDWSPLLRHALSSTLNGLLDAKETYQGDDKWVGAALDALAEARKAPEGGDNYLLGLLQGKGYQLLISKGLSEASERLSDDELDVFQNIAADLLKAAAPLVTANTRNFASFFRDHWGDILNAGLKSLEKHGPTLLADQPDLLKETLLAVMQELAATNGKELFTSDTLFNVVDAAIGVVAAKPELITGGIQEEWLKKLIGSVAKTVGNVKIRNTFSREGLESIVKDAAGTFAEHPELIVKKHDVFQAVVGGILSKISGVDRLTAKSIADAAVGGALKGIADNPALLDTRYSSVIAGFAGNLAKLVADRSLTGLQAKDIMSAATESMLENPILFNELGDKISTAIVDAILETAKSSSTGLLAGSTLLDIVTKLFSVFAQQGARLADENSLNKLTKKLLETLTAALVRSEKEIGKRLTVKDLPDVLGEFVATLARGELPASLTDEERFETLFNKIVQQVNA